MSTDPLRRYRETAVNHRFLHHHRRGFVLTGWVIVTASLLCGCGHPPQAPSIQPQAAPSVCDASWYETVEAALTTGDGAGHGPDPGSDEWKSVVEFKLGVRGQPDIPPRDSEAWCTFVDSLVSNRMAGSAGPSYSCDGPMEATSIESLICRDAVLSALDRQLAEVYRAALLKSANEHPPVLVAEQRGWIKGRDDCWKAADQYRCISNTYQRRTAELQARYDLVGSIGPIAFSCDDQPAKEVVVTFYRTNVPTLIAEFGDRVSVMYQVAATSGIRYQGRNESFQKQSDGVTTIVWGYQQPPMNCQQKTAAP